MCTIIFRLRRQMLELARCLDMGAVLVNITPIKRMALMLKYNVSRSDMDFSNKQCF